MLGIQFLEVTYVLALISVPLALVYWTPTFLLGFLLVIITGCYVVIKRSQKPLVDTKGRGVLITGCDTGRRREALILTIRLLHEVQSWSGYLSRNHAILHGKS